jgi:hypothetical protein
MLLISVVIAANPTQATTFAIFLRGFTLVDIGQYIALWAMVRGPLLGESILLQIGGTSCRDPVCFLIRTADAVFDANPPAAWCLRSLGLAGGGTGSRPCRRHTRPVRMLKII